MASVDFTQETEPAAPAAVVEKAVAVRQETAIAEYRTGEVEGEITRDDRVTPRLSLVAKTGDLSNDFTPGNWVYSKTHDFGAGPLVVIALHAKKIFREATDFDNPHTENPRIFNTSAEVQAGGLVVGKPTTKAYGEEAAPEAMFLLWIEKPANLTKPEAAEAFDVILPSGREGALAIYTAARSSYNTAGKPILTAPDMNRKVRTSGLASQQWTLVGKLEKYDGKTWWQAHIRPKADAVSAEDLAYLKEIAG